MRLSISISIRAVRRFLALPLLLASVELAVADVPLFTVQSESFASGTINLGYSFTLNHELTVTGLGKHDVNRNGLLDDQTEPQVAIWNTFTGELIALAVIDANQVAVGLRP